MAISFYQASRHFLLQVSQLRKQKQNCSTCCATMMPPLQFICPWRQPVSLPYRSVALLHHPAQSPFQPIPLSAVCLPMRAASSPRDRCEILSLGIETEASIRLIFMISSKVRRVPMILLSRIHPGSSLAIKAIPSPQLGLWRGQGFMRCQTVRRRSRSMRFWR